MNVELYSKDFFLCYLNVLEMEIDDDDESEPLTVELWASPDIGLRIEVDLEMATADLLLLHPTFAEPIQLGWSDLAHWHSNVLRPEEVDMLVDQLVLSPPHGNTKAVIRLLLILFAAPTRASNIEAYQQGNVWALQQLGFTKEEIAEIRAQAFHPKIFEPLDTLEWTSEGDKWLAMGEEAYSLRGIENPLFPHIEFADLFS